jgi:hypothetical protein
MECGLLGKFFSLDTINSQHNCEHLSSYERTFTFLTQDSAIGRTEDRHLNCFQHVFGEKNEGFVAARLFGV